MSISLQSHWNLSIFDRGSILHHQIKNYSNEHGKLTLPVVLTISQISQNVNF